MPEEPKQPAISERLPVPVELIERRIFVIRGQRVMLDSDLADLYHVTTGNLNLAVRRNGARFPQDFMFQLTKEETDSLLLQSARAKTGRGGRQTLPFAFTEQGVAMLSSVLSSERAVQMNILIIRAFVKMREIFEHNKVLARKVEQLETKQKDHSVMLALIVEDIEGLSEGVKKEFKKLKAPRRRKYQIGFRASDDLANK